MELQYNWSDKCLGLISDSYSAFILLAIVHLKTSHKNAMAVYRWGHRWKNSPRATEPASDRAGIKLPEWHTSLFLPTKQILRDSASSYEHKTQLRRAGRGAQMVKS